MTMRELFREKVFWMLMVMMVCIVSFLCISLIPVPMLELVGCGICGFSVGILWPGTFSKASAALKRGGTVMFAMLALAGDLGCSGGPTLVGFVSSAFDNNLRIGIFAGILFPVVLLSGLMFAGKKGNIY